MVVDELSTVVPIIAVLGNHDLHSDMGDEIGEILEAGRDHRARSLRNRRRGAR